MKKLTALLCFTIFLSFFTHNLFAQGTPPPPPSGGPGVANNNNYVRGGDAPVGDGLILLLLMGGIFVAVKLKGLKQKENASV